MRPDLFYYKIECWVRVCCMHEDELQSGSSVMNIDVTVVAIDTPLTIVLLDFPILHLMFM